MTIETVFFGASLIMSAFALYACYRFAREESVARTIFFFLIASSLFTSAANIVRKTPPVDPTGVSREAPRTAAPID